MGFVPHDNSTTEIVVHSALEPTWHSPPMLVPTSSTMDGPYMHYYDYNSIIHCCFW